MAYAYFRVTLSEQDKELLLALLDTKLKTFENFSDPEFTQAFRLRDKIETTRLYKIKETV
jgi:hypothetical protein